MSIQVYETEEHAPGEPPYEIRVEHAEGWETVNNAVAWESNAGGVLSVEFSDIGKCVEYEEGEVFEVVTD